MMFLSFLINPLISFANHVIKFWKCEHPELEMCQTRLLTFDGQWIWNWSGVFYIPSYGTDSSITSSLLPLPLPNALLHGTGIFKREYPNGIHCKKIVKEFQESGKTLKEFINATNLEKKYVDAVSHIEILDENTYETVILE